MLNGRDREDEIKRGIAKRQPARVAAHEADAVRLLAVARTREQGRRNIDARVGLRASQIASIPPSPAADLQNVPRSSFIDRKSTRLNSSHPSISYAVFCLKKK